VIIQDGIRRMYGEGESVFYYLTVMNEAYAMAAMPDGAGVREGIVKGLYRCVAAPAGKGKLRAQLLGSGAILPEVLKAQTILDEKYGVRADVWSATSYGELYREGHAAERWNMLHPGEKPRVPYVTQQFEGTEGPIIAASDYLKVLPDLIDRWLPRPLVSLGTDGFGRSESRAALRNHFEVDARFVTVATLAALAREGQVDSKLVQKAIKDLEIDVEKRNPFVA
jgi:pyruvate dehydrogenase E1 component